MHPENLNKLVSSRSIMLSADFETKTDQVFQFLSHQNLGPSDLVATRLPTELDVVFAAALARTNTSSCVLGNGPLSGPIKPDLVISVESSDGNNDGKFVLADASLLRRIGAVEPTRHTENGTRSSAFSRLIFSSGTTGNPKAVVFSKQMLEDRYRFGLEQWMTKSPFMCLLGLGSSSGYLSFYANMKSSGTYFAPGSADDNFDLIKRHEIKLVTASPHQISALIDVALERGEKLPSLELIQAAGSFLPNQLARLAEKILGGKVRNLYGSTEAGLITRRDNIPEDPFFTGTLVEDVELEIVTESHQVLPIGEEGIVRYRREGMAAEYYKNPEATQLAFREGWFYPGDRGRLDSDRGLYLAGRVSEGFNSGGVKIDPIRIDNFAVDSAGVVDAAAFAFEDDRAVQKTGLAVVSEAGFDVIAFVSKLKATFGEAHPTVVFQVDEIPRNETGKLLRSKLTELYNSVRKP